MPAPKGNKFWEQRSKHGRDQLFESPEKLWEAACEYFQWCEDNPLKEEKLFHYQGEIITGISNKMRAFTIEGLCSYLKCNRVYFNTFQPKENIEDFNNVITRIRETIYRQKFEGAASDFLNANIIARDLGLKDNKDITSGGEKVHTITGFEVK